MKVHLYASVLTSYVFFLVGMTVGALAHDNAGWMFISCLGALIGMSLGLLHAHRRGKEVS